MRPRGVGVIQSLLVIYAQVHSLVASTPCISAPTGLFEGGAYYDCHSQRDSLGNAWGAIPSGMVPVLPNTTWVNFANNRIEQLPPLLFGRFGFRTVNVRFVELQRNLITSIPSGMFDGLTRLELLKLEQNPIWAMPQDFFTTIPQLSRLESEGITLPSEGADANLVCSASTINGATYVQCTHCAVFGLRLFVDVNFESCCIPEWQELCFTPQPTAVPTVSPTTSPTVSPTMSPTIAPTISPSTSPTESPSSFPTSFPTHFPTSLPTHSPTVSPSMSPTFSSPTSVPTVSSPTSNPITTRPTEIEETFSPTIGPTRKPTITPTLGPTKVPTTSYPSTLPTVTPTRHPTVSPTRSLLFPLALAAMIGESALVEQLVAANSSVNQQDGSGTTALLAAAREGHLDTVSVLHRLGADITHTVNDGTTVLLAAAAGGHVPVMTYALENGANILERKDNGESAMYIAASRGFLGAMNLLLNRTSSIRQTISGQVVSSGMTPLLVAAAEGHLDAFNLLLNASANVYHQRFDGGSAVVLSAAAGHLPLVVRILTVAPDINGIDLALVSAARNGHTTVVDTILMHSERFPSTARLAPLAIAEGTISGHRDVVDTLLDRNYSYDMSTNQFLLQPASKFGMTNAVTQLLEQGTLADTVNTEAVFGSIEGTTSICLATTEGHADIVEALLTAGAVPTQTCANDVSLLFLAAKMPNSADTVSVLLAAGAFIEFRDTRGRSPLFAGAAAGNAASVSALIQAGAEAGSRGAIPGGLTPLGIASMSGHTEVIQAIINGGVYVDDPAGPNGESALQLALVNARSDVVSYLLSMNATFEFSETANSQYTRWAAQTGQLQLVLQILDSTDALVPNTTEVPSSSVLLPNVMLGATVGGHLELVLLALNRGQPVNDLLPPFEVGAPRRSALFVACTNGHLDIVSALIDAGSNIDSEPNLLAAVEVGAEDIVELLLAAAVVRNVSIVNVGDSGVSPLIAAASAHVNITIRLLSANADSAVVDGTGRTALALASLGGSESTVAAILEFTSDEVNVLDDTRTSPLWLAAKSFHFEIVKLLLQYGAIIDPDRPTVLLPETTRAPSRLTTQRTFDRPPVAPNNEDEDEIFGLGISGTALIAIASVVGSLMVGCIIYKAFIMGDDTKKVTEIEDYDPELDLPFEEGATIENPTTVQGGQSAVLNNTMYTANQQQASPQHVIILPAGTMVYQAPQDASMPGPISPSPYPDLGAVPSPSEVDFGYLNLAYRDQPDIWQKGNSPPKAAAVALPGATPRSPQPATVPPPAGPGVSPSIFGESQPQRYMIRYGDALGSDQLADTKV